MNYWVHQDTILEGWKDRAVHAVNPDKQIISLSREEKAFLLTCDGREQTKQPIAERLLINKVITCDEKEGTEPVFELHSYLRRNGAYLAITGRCNYSCRHCIAADGLDDSSDELSLETLCDLFDQMKALGITRLWLTGGEPMIHPHFSEIVEEATKRGMKITRLLTNGTFLTQESLDHLKKWGQYPEMGISFDGIGTHDWMRCHEGAEALSLAGIDLAVKNGFSVTPHINVNHVTAPVIIETCRVLVKEHGVRSFRMMPTARSPRWNAMAGPHDKITNDEYFGLMLDLLRTNYEEHWGATIDMVNLSMVYHTELLKNPPQLQPHAPIMHWCRRASDLIFIAHDGRVLPCNAYEGTSKQYGFLCGDDININKRPLKDILTDSEYVHFCTEKIENHLRDMEKCRTCKWVGLCCGGCPLFALGNRMHLADENPQCEFYTKGWAEQFIALMDEIEGK